MKKTLNPWKTISGPILEKYLKNKKSFIIYQCLNEQVSYNLVYKKANNFKIVYNYYKLKIKQNFTNKPYVFLTKKNKL